MNQKRATHESNIGLNLDPNIPPQAPGKEKNYPILEGIDMNESTSVVHSCEGLIGNVLSRPDVLPPTFNEDNCYNFLVFLTLKLPHLEDLLKLYRLLQQQLRIKMHKHFHNTSNQTH